jgi:hypothetical protein
VPPEDDWKFKFGCDDRGLALDDHDCEAAFPGFYEGVTRATQLRGNRVIMLEELASIKISNGMVRAMIHGGQVISPPQVGNIIDGRLGVVECPFCKFSRPRTLQESRCYSSHIISSNYSNASRLYYTKYRMDIHNRILPHRHQKADMVPIAKSSRRKLLAHARFRILERTIRRPRSIRRNCLPGHRRHSRPLLGL